MGKNWAICIGINEYYNLRPLKYAERDAQAFRDFCLHDAQFDHGYFFAEGADSIATDFGPPLRAEPTIGNLERFLRVRFEEAFLEPGDNLWFFFAGHGKRYQGRDYLMPIDGDAGNVGRTGLAIRDVVNRLRRSGADNVILMLDACRGEDDRDAGEGIGLEKQQGVVTLFSCSPNELAYEIDELQAGSFTHALLEGLCLQGEGNCATVERLCHHLRYTVPDLNRRYRKRPQNPYAIIEPATKLHLILLPRQATLQDVMALKNDALEAEAETNLDLAEQLWIRVLAASSADRQAIKALQRIALRRASQPPNLSQTLPLTSETTSRRAVATPSPTETSSPPKPTFSFEFVTVDATGNITDPQSRSAEYRREVLGDGIALDLVRIPAGEFMMGSPEGEEGREWYQRYESALTNVEGPQHRVAISAFWMGKYPITQAQWRAVAALPQVEQELNPDPSSFKGDNRPVEQISWHDTVEFCARLSKKTGRDYQLPSEAKWEYACRAGTTTPFHFGETITTDIASYRGTDWDYEGTTYPGHYGRGPKGLYREETTEVGSFPPNAFGLYDMHGNVWEWCLDYWHESYQKAPKNETAWTHGGDDTYRMLRGGSWPYSPRHCRSASRFRYRPDFSYNLFGCRVVCSSAWTV